MNVASAVLLSVLVQAADSTPADRLLRHALAGLAADALMRVERVGLDEVAIQSWPGQGPSPVNPVRTRLVLRHGVASRPEGRLEWTFLQETPTGEKEWCQTTAAGSDAIVQTDCVSGIATRSARGLPDPVAAALRAFPHARLAALAGAVQPGQMARASDVDGRAAWSVSLPAPGGGRTEWYFDRGNGLPFRVDFPATDELGRSETAIDRFDEYRRVGPFLLPFRLERIRPNNAPSEVVRVADVRFEGVVVPVEPAPAVVSDVSPRQRVDTLAPGVWQINDVVPTYNVLLVSQPAGLVQIEAPGGSAGQARVDETAAALAPGVPLTAVVVTHFHHDHLSGLSSLLERGVPIYLPETAIAHVRRFLGDSALTADLRPAEGVRLGQGDSVVELVEHRASPHVDRMVFPVLPGPRVVFVSDLFFLEPSGHVRPAGSEVDPFLQVIAALPFRPARFGSGHWGPFELSDLEQAVLARQEHKRP